MPFCTTLSTRSLSCPRFEVSHTRSPPVQPDECWHATILLAVVAAPSRSPLKVESLPVACGLVAWARSHYVEGGWGDGRAVCDLSQTVAPLYSTQVDVITPFHPPHSTQVTSAIFVKWVGWLCAPGVRHRCQRRSAPELNRRERVCCRDARRQCRPGLHRRLPEGQSLAGSGF